MKARLVLVLAVLTVGASCQSTFRPKCKPASISQLTNLEPSGNTVPLLCREACEKLITDTGITQVAHRPHQRQFNTLVLSGGGAYGAYSAGVLVGWSEQGTRPEFNVVTGVSTGAMVAALAFLGPERDEQLKTLYTTLSDNDIYRMKFEPFAVFTEALADATPLQNLIAKVADRKLMKEVAREHAKGRRLYVGTTQLDARRLIVWDMGAIASKGDEKSLDLFRRILLASAAIPGFFPPVPIEIEVDGKVREEMHVDGGVTASLFFRSPQVSVEERIQLGNNPLAGSNLFVIVAGKLFADPACVAPRFSQIAESSITALLHAQTRGDLLQMFTLCLVTNMNYRLTAVPQDFALTPSSTSFNPEEMTRLFELGRTRARDGSAWRATPPGLEPGEQTPFRTGTRFATPKPR